MYCMFIFVDDIYRFRLNITVSDHRCIHSFQCKMKSNLAFLTHLQLKRTQLTLYSIRILDHTGGILYTFYKKTPLGKESLNSDGPTIPPMSRQQSPLTFTL